VNTNSFTYLCPHRLPLVQCTQKFSSIDASYKDSIRDMIVKYAEKFG